MKDFLFSFLLTTGILLMIVGSASNLEEISSVVFLALGLVLWFNSAFSMNNSQDELRERVFISLTASFFISLFFL